MRIDYDTDKVKGLLLSLADQWACGEGTTEMDIEAMTELCQIALRYFWLKSNYDLATSGIDDIPLDDAMIDTAMRAVNVTHDIPRRIKA